MNHCAIYNTCLYAIIRTEPTQLILTSALFTTMLFILFPRLANFIATLLFMRAAILVGHVLIESTMYSPNPEVQQQVVALLSGTHSLSGEP